MTTPTTDVTRTVERYFEMWNETDPARRRALIADIWSPVASYVDPMFTAEGYEGLDTMVAGVPSNVTMFTRRVMSNTLSVVRASCQK